MKLNQIALPLALATACPYNDDAPVEPILPRAEEAVSEPVTSLLPAIAAAIQGSVAVKCQEVGNNWKSLECSSGEGGRRAYADIYVGPISGSHWERVEGEPVEGFGSMVRYFVSRDGAYTLSRDLNRGVPYIFNPDSPNVLIEKFQGLVEFSPIGAGDPLLAKKTVDTAVGMLKGQLQNVELQETLDAADKIQRSHVFQADPIGPKDAGILYGKYRREDVAAFPPETEVGGALPGYNNRGIDCRIRSAGDVTCQGVALNEVEKIDASGTCIKSVGKAVLADCKIEGGIESTLAKLRSLSSCVIAQEPERVTTLFSMRGLCSDDSVSVFTR